MKFNDLDLFSDGPFRKTQKTFISVLQSQWLSAAEQVVKDRLGLEGNNTDTFKVVVNDKEINLTIFRSCGITLLRTLRIRKPM